MSSISPSSPSDKGQIPVEEALRTIHAGLEKVDAERGVAYGTLAILRTAKSNSLDRHRQLLTRKLGAKHPRVIALQAQDELIRRQLPELQAAQVQATTPPPTVKSAGYALHGFVRTSERAPIARAVVAIYDINGTKREDFNYATTDANGYFKLTTPRLFGSTKADEKPGAQSPETVALEVRVFDAQRRPLQHSLPTIDAPPGRADFREVLVVESQSTAAPPDTVSANAPPPTGSNPRPDARRTLKIIADGLSKPRQTESAKTRKPKAKQKGAKAKTRKQAKA